MVDSGYQQDTPAAMSVEVRFTETMSGWLSPAVEVSHEAAAAEGRTARRPASFTLVVVTPNVPAMVADPNHRNTAFGLVECPTLDGVPLRVEEGHLDLFAEVAPGILHMRYRLALATEDGRRFTLRGIKEIVRRRWFPTSLSDTTTLFVDVFDGETTEGQPRLRGILTMGPGGVLAQALSFRGNLAGIVKFLAYYVGKCRSVYLGARRAPLRPTWSQVVVK